MLGKPVSGKNNPAASDGSNARFLHEIEALSKALSLDTKKHRALSAGRSRPADPNPKPIPKTNPKPSSQKEKKPSSSSSFWSWKPLKALSHIGQRRFDCLFSLHVHSIDGLPPALADASVSVHWRRTNDVVHSAAGTHPSKVFLGVAEFEETLSYRCSVYGTKSASNRSAKYDPRHFLIYASVIDSPGLDLGKNVVDLTRLLPLTLEELEEEEKSSGKWSTSFRLSGKGKGASLNVSFGFSIMGNDFAESVGDKKVAELLSLKAHRVDRKGSIGRVGNQIRSHDRSRSVEDVKVLHEVLPSTKSEVSVLANIGGELEFGKYDSRKVCSLEVDLNPEFEVFDLQDESLHKLKSCTVLEPVKGCEEKESEEPEFMVIEQGIEITAKDQCETELEKVEVDAEGVDAGGEVGKEELGEEPGDQVDEISNQGHVPDDDSGLLAEDPVTEDFESRPCSYVEPKGPEQISCAEFKSNYRTESMKSNSADLDDVTDSVASEFLSMLGIEHSPPAVSSESDPESPREQLWKQFEKDSLGGMFGHESNWADVESSEDFDLSSIVHEAESEIQKANQAMDSKSRAKLLEDAENEALMRQWGLNEKAFQSSPPGCRSGFGSPIDLPLEEPIELPPLCEGLGPFIETKDGGFLRSMSPDLFKNAKNSGSLIMQVSSPVVVPADMGSNIMEILQCLASVGIEKLSMQAKKLMPLEDVTGKTMQQIAWEASSVPEASERKDLSQHMEPEVDSRICQNPSDRSKKTKSSNLASSTGGEMGSEYVLLEDLAPLAMEKIEALSIEGLRVQSGMSDEEAPSNISPQSIGDISALEGKGAMNIRSLGLEGTAGLQLLDVKDNEGDVDGLMGLSITLDEWMRLDSGIVDEEDLISDRTSKILAAHHACSTEFTSGGWKGDSRGGRRSGKRWGLLGNNFTVALMVQLRDPLRNYEPVGTPMLSLIQVERVFVPPKPKIYSTVSEKGKSEQDDDEPEAKSEPAAKEEMKDEEDVVPQFKITEVHVAGLKTEPSKKKLWGNSVQQQSGSRWLLASGMGKSNKHPFMKSKAASKPSPATTKVQPGETLWSISSRVHGSGAKWKELMELNPHIRNPDVIFPNETIRLR